MPLAGVLSEPGVVRGVPALEPAGSIMGIRLCAMKPLAIVGVSNGVG
jgi:hypothetical protein